MDPKICISIGDVRFDTCLKVAALSPLIEVRLDQMHLDVEKIEILALQSRQWVATCRPGNYSEYERTVQLSAAIRAGASYIDIEYEADPAYRDRLVDLARQQRCKVIISYHNFESTPSTEFLDEIIKKSKDMGGDLVKIAITAHSYADCARVMSLYEHHDNLIAFAMGEKGKITRIAAPMLGAEFTYASIDEAHVTAPGQLTASQMEVIYSILESNLKR